MRFSRELLSAVRFIGGGNKNVQVPAKPLDATKSQELGTSFVMGLTVAVSQHFILQNSTSPQKLFNML